MVLHLAAYAADSAAGTGHQDETRFSQSSASLRDPCHLAVNQGNDMYHFVTVRTWPMSRGTRSG
jgi:hypothetical protein